MVASRSPKSVVEVQFLSFLGIRFCAMQSLIFFIFEKVAKNLQFLGMWGILEWKNFYSFIRIV